MPQSQYLLFESILSFIQVLGPSSPGLPCQCCVLSCFSHVWLFVPQVLGFLASAVCCYFSCVWLCNPLGCRPLCPWNSPGKNTGVGCHFLLQGDLPKPGIESVLCLLHWQAGFLPLAPPRTQIFILPASCNYSKHYLSANFCCFTDQIHISCSKVPKTWKISQRGKLWSNGI